MKKYLLLLLTSTSVFAGAQVQVCSNETIQFCADSTLIDNYIKLDGKRNRLAQYNYNNEEASFNVIPNDSQQRLIVYTNDNVKIYRPDSSEIIVLPCGAVRNGTCH